MMTERLYTELYDNGVRNERVTDRRRRDCVIYHRTRIVFSRDNFFSDRPWIQSFAAIVGHRLHTDALVWKRKPIQSERW